MPYRRAYLIGWCIAPLYSQLHISYGWWPWWGRSSVELKGIHYIDIQLNLNLKPSQASFLPSLKPYQPSLIPNQPTWSPIRPMKPVQLYQTQNPFLQVWNPCALKVFVSSWLGLYNPFQTNLICFLSPNSTSSDLSPQTSQTQNQLSYTPNHSSENLSQPHQTFSLSSKAPKLLHHEGLNTNQVSSNTISPVWPQFSSFYHSCNPFKPKFCPARQIDGAKFPSILQDLVP